MQLTPLSTHWAPRKINKKGYNLFRTRCILDSDDEPTEKPSKTPQPSTSTDADFTADLQSNELHGITQEELNDLIRDLDLPKCKAELLGSRMQQWNFLKENIRISVYRLK